jgi:hypothetical protein
MNFTAGQLYRHLMRISCVWAFFAAIVAAFAASGIRMAKLSRDPAELADVPIYYGLLSNLGALVWAAGAFISFFASSHVDDSKVRSLLRWAGILTLILLLDDFLLIHDEVFPNVLHLPEWLVYLFYLMTFPLFFFRHLDAILKQTEYRILALGIFLMGVSALIDMHVLPGGIDVEDSFKLSGIVAYSYYWVFTSHRLIAQSGQRPRSEPVSH